MVNLHANWARKVVSPKLASSMQHLARFRMQGALSIGFLGLRRVMSGVAFVVLVSACSSEPEAAAPTSTAAPVTTTSTTTAAIPAVTTIEVVAPAAFSSSGEIEISDEVFSFAFECWAAGAGDVLALGIGQRQANGEQVQAIVQAFLGDPYVAVVVGEDQVLELAVDQRAELFVQQDSIRGSALRFVDAEAPGVGEAVGFGSVNVDCQGFAPGLPEGYVVTPQGGTTAGGAEDTDDEPPS